MLSRVFRSIMTILVDFSDAGNETTSDGRSTFTPIHLPIAVDRAVYYYALFLGRNFIRSGVGAGSFRALLIHWLPRLGGARLVAPLIDLKLLHRKWITLFNLQERIDCCHSKFLGFMQR